MDLSFKCPLCETYFATNDDLKEHVKAIHTSYYYDTYLVPPVLIFPGGTTTVVESETPATVITTEPVSSADVFIEPAPVPDDGCCECDCCDCCGGDIGADAGGTDAGGCGDCDCDCDCVIM
ncbi:uncharacterized protein LOC135709356 [Ochlerotatus camptorhynchus]|uniref:uncharacterized protein LOC135709356 n=1 Tax=Ochlerotatus camptorhynchus TaxID=644619 RepID=UPI0031D35745